MKKLLFSLASAVLLLSSCGNDENVVETTKTGTLQATITFSEANSGDNGGLRAAQSTAIPTTGWENINKVQLFFYDAATGIVKHSYVLDPSTAADKKFTWKDIPHGTYTLALVANVRSAESDNVATSLDGGATLTHLTATNVKDKKVNDEIFIDLKKEAAGFPSNYDPAAGEVAYMPASEIFTAYAYNVQINDTKNDLGTLTLKREISLMRLRINRENKLIEAPKLSDVIFDHAESFISIQNMPVGLGLQLGTFAGGIYSTPFDANRVIVAATGVNTYNDQDPTTGYGSGLESKILGGDFSLWKDIRLLPNATRAEGKLASAEANPTQRYIIYLGAWVPGGYKFADETIAGPGGQMVYWPGTITGVFAPNVIREVNINIMSPGWPVRPPVVPKGELVITMGNIAPWDSNIESEDIAVQ